MPYSHLPLAIPLSCLGPLVPAGPNDARVQNQCWDHDTLRDVGLRIGVPDLTDGMAQGHGRAVRLVCSQSCNADLRLGMCTFLKPLLTDMNRMEMDGVPVHIAMALMVLVASDLPRASGPIVCASCCECFGRAVCRHASVPVLTRARLVTDMHASGAMCWLAWLMPVAPTVYGILSSSSLYLNQLGQCSNSLQSLYS